MERESADNALPGMVPGNGAAGPVDDGAWALRRYSLETARESIEAIEKAISEAEGTCYSNRVAFVPGVAFGLESLQDFGGGHSWGWRRPRHCG